MSSSSPEPIAWRRGHPAAWLLERLAFEPEGAGAEVAAHGSSCERCRRVVEDLRAERERFLESRPPRPFIVHLVEESTRANRGGARRNRMARWAFASGAAAVVALLWLVPGSSPGPVRFKGGGPSALAIFSSPGGEPARLLERGRSLHPGDLVRFGVLSPRPAHAFIASIDEEGRYTRYHPQEADRSAPLEGHESVQLLPGSVALDETLGREWMVLLLSRKPLAGADVAAALRDAWRDRKGDQLGPVGLEAEVHVVLVTKERR